MGLPRGADGGPVTFAATRRVEQAPRYVLVPPQRDVQG
jgi:hypothetical protein